MTQFQRYAVYYAPLYGPLAEFGAAWLGRDAVHGIETPPLHIPDLPHPSSEITKSPRKYGFHATIKPPMRLAEGANYADIAQELEALARKTRPIALAGLELTPLGRFLALTISGDAAPLSEFAGTIVQRLDKYRAPMTAEEFDRRNAAHLTDSQRDNLKAWGYPYVMDQFRFHMTLTDKLPKTEVGQVADCLRPHLIPILPFPFIIDAVSIFGEDSDGLFHHIERFPLGRI